MEALMRLVLVIILMSAIWISGWIMGSLSPAPQGILNPIKGLLSGSERVDEIGEDVVEDETTAETDETDTPPAATVDPEPEPAPQPVVLEGEAALTQYRAWISEARATYPYAESESRMYDVMMCESGGDASVINPAGPYSGLFQYANTTWNGDWNTYRETQVTDARAQIFATALAWNLGMQSHWGCYNSTG